MNMSVKTFNSSTQKCQRDVDEAEEEEEAAAKLFDKVTSVKTALLDKSPTTTSTTVSRVVRRRRGRRRCLWLQRAEEVEVQEVGSGCDTANYDKQASNSKNMLTINKLSTALSLLSRVVLLPMLIALLATTTITPILLVSPAWSRGLAAKTTIAVTCMAMQMSPIAATKIANHYKQHYADDVSTTGVLQHARQLQQQHSFALLQPDVMKQEYHENAGIGKQLLRRGRGGGVPGLPLDMDNDDDEGDSPSFTNANDDDDDDDDVNALSLKLIEDYVAQTHANGFLETTGFVADDGQQYEKVSNSNNVSNQQQLIASSQNCPPACKCLNVFFDCSKLQLKQIPDLPDYVEHLDLMGNQLNELSALQIHNFSQLHKISLKRNVLESIPKFVGLVALKHLNLANNRIKRIDSAALMALPKLKSLDLSRNNLHSVEAKYFPTNNRLVHL